MRTYWPSLDGLRAVAVLIVLAAHAGLPFPLSGGTGVDIFFVLSGFLITTILCREVTATNRINLKHFYIRRFLRLAPCLWMTSLFFGLWFWWTRGSIPGRELAITLTYTANWARAIFDTDLSSMSHGWSLAIEEQYYLLWPLCIWGLGRISRQPWIQALLLLNVALLLALYRCAMVGHFTAGRIYFALDTHMDGLVIGSAISYVWLAIDAQGGLSGRLSQWLSWGFAPAAIAGLLLVMGKLTWVNSSMSKAGFFLVALASATLILDLTLSPFSWLKPLLMLKPMLYVGRISYGLYLWHYPIFHAIDEAWPQMPFGGLVAIKLATSFAVASLSYHLVEKRFLNWKKRFESHPENAVLSASDPSPGFSALVSHRAA